jgi:hypothetical protein
MQGLMAVTQGLSAIDGAIDGFNDLTAAMGAAGAKLKSFVTGLGKLAAPIAIVTALGTAFVKLKNWIDGTSTALNNRTIEQNKFNASLQKELEIRQRAGFTEEETLLFEISQYEIRNQKLIEHNAALKAENDQVAKNAEASRNAASAFGGAVANQAAYRGVQQASNVNVGANTALMAENTKEINKNAEALEDLKDQLDTITKARELAAKRVKDIPVDPIVPSGTSTSTTPTIESDIVDQAYDLVRLQDEAIKRNAQIVKILDVEKLHTQLLEVQREEAAILELYGVVTDKSGKITQTYNKASQDALENNIKGLADLEKILELKQKQLAIEEQITKKIKEEIEAATPKSAE